MAGLLRAVLVSWQPCSLLKWSSHKLLPVERTVALSMKKYPVLERVTLHAVTGVFSFACWPVKSGGTKGRFKNKPIVVGL